LREVGAKSRREIRVRGFLKKSIRSVVMVPGSESAWRRPRRD